MAQYKRNFYGSSYYGETNAFSGTYETADILTEEPLKNTFNVNIKAILPDMIYGFTSQDIVRAGTWETAPTGDFLRSNVASSKLTFTATCDHLVFNYQARPNGCVLNLKLTTVRPGQAAVVTNKTLDTNNVSILQRQEVFTGLPYGNHTLEITIDAATPTTKYLYFKSIQARVCSFTVETRARVGAGGTYTPYTPSALTITPVAGKEDGFTITAVSPNYAGKDRIQIRVWMASSDNEISPIIEEIDTYAGDTNNRTEDGSWTATIAMESVASALGKTFLELLTVTWTGDQPTGTKMTIRTRGTNDVTRTNWGPWSVPYVAGVSRMRIKEGANQGYVITPIINPAAINKNLRIDHWVEWLDSSYLPPDESGTRILYEFLDESDGILHRIDQPKYIANKTLLNSTLANKPYRIKMTLSKRVDKSSPVVDYIKLTSNLIYEERKIVEKQGFSSVDNMNTGEQMILDMSTLTWNPPSEASTPLYYLEDQTQRPRDVLLYLESTNALPPSIARPNTTLNRMDKVWARVNVDTRPLDSNITGVYKHYQYGGGTAVIIQPDVIPLANSFTPALDTSKEYRYYIMLGWFNAETGTVNAGTVNENVELIWKSQALLNPRTQVTEVSSHNALVKNLADRSSDSIQISVIEQRDKEEVEWVSEEKIFFGTVNINDEQSDYVRKHTAPESGESVEMKYMVGTGETFAIIARKFQMEEYDLRFVNQVNVGEPAEGSVIIVPAAIVLPRIDPKARVGDNPYQVDIVYNSVMQGTKLVPDDRIIIRSLDVEYADATIVRERVERGDIPHGKDVLGNGRIKSIIGIWNNVSEGVTPVSDYQEGLDYVLDGNFVNWSPTEGFSREPVAGAAYYVSYVYERAKTVTVIIGSDYQEEGGVNRVWRSPEVREFSGTCSPGIDHKAELPATSTWSGATNPEVEDLEYIIEDNDLWVKSWIEFDAAANKFYAVGSLQDRIPKDNWFPTIQTGFYYAGKEEYYLFSEPVTVEPTDAEMARSENIQYVNGKYDKAAQFQKESMNIIRNSGFEKATNRAVVQKITFS